MQIVLNVNPEQANKILGILGLPVVCESGPSLAPAPTAEASTEKATLPPAEPGPLTREDVAEAINAHASVHGSSSAMSLMKDVGGAAKLSAINPSRYEDLVAALKVEK